MFIDNSIHTTHTKLIELNYVQWCKSQKSETKDRELSQVPYHTLDTIAPQIFQIAMQYMCNEYKNAHFHTIMIHFVPVYDDV